jgi:hypothetical protein
MHTYLCYNAQVKQKIMRPALQKRFLQKFLTLWPALKGSLAEVYKPCIRPNCRICARGDKHPNFLLAFTEKGRRRCLYVPKPMVPALKRALENGRQVERLLYQVGPALLQEYRARHPTQTGPMAKRRPLRPKSRTKS